jgi:hypothetical protein
MAKRKKKVPEMEIICKREHELDNLGNLGEHEYFKKQSDQHQKSALKFLMVIWAIFSFVLIGVVGVQTSKVKSHEETIGKLTYSTNVRGAELEWFQMNEIRNWAKNTDEESSVSKEFDKWEKVYFSLNKENRDNFKVISFFYSQDKVKQNKSFMEMKDINIKEYKKCVLFWSEISDKIKSFKG